MNRMHNHHKTLWVIELALMAGLAVWLLTGGLALQAQDQLSEKVIRLHVLANSDSEEDQVLKLKVRDRVLSYADELLEQSTDHSEAEARLRGSLLELERIAGEEIAANGYAYPVSVELEKTSFPTREYDGFTLPAGEYLALRVLIGAAEGKNWWCVIFPPLCTAVASEVRTCALAAGLDGEQISLITEEDQGYVLKFKAVELWETLRQRFPER